MKYYKIINVTDVVNYSICCGCGACYVACSNNAICFEKNLRVGLYTPKISQENCNNCGKCLRVCFGLKSLDIDKWQTSGDSLKAINCNFSLGSSLGSYESILVGYSNNDALRFSASSGGVVTEILKYCLKHKLADGAIVVRMKCNNDLNSEAYIACSEPEITEAMGSKYFPTSNCLCLKNIISDNTNNGRRYIFVGLPCQIYGLNSLKEIFPELKNRILFSIGLFCGHMVDFYGTQTLIESQRMCKQDISSIKFRGDGWPGYCQIEQGKFCHRIDSSRVWNDFFNTNLFTPQRCMFCSDFFSEFSDLSVGDAWDKDILDEKTAGYSLIVSRSKFSEDLLQRMVQSGVISLRNYPVGKVRENFSNNIFVKKKLNLVFSALYLNVQTSFWDKCCKIRNLGYFLFTIFRARRVLRFFMKYSLFRKFFNKIYVYLYCYLKSCF